MVVLRGGEVLFSAAYPPVRPALEGVPGIYNYTDPDWHPLRDGLHTMQSVTKTVLSALVGIALKRGDLQSVEQPVAPFFASARIDPSLTIEHLLTMRAGLSWEEEKDWPAMEASPDWLAYVLARQPGQMNFNYSSGVPILMASLLTQVTGESIENYARKYLFGPLGIEHFLWKSSPNGLADTQGGLYLSTLDLAKFGWMYLRSEPGVFSQDWAQESFRPRALEEDWRYGFGWWLLPHPLTPGEWVPTALGYGGQRLFLLPRQNLVAAFTGWNPGGKNSLPYEKALQILVGCN